MFRKLSSPAIALLSALLVPLVSHAQEGTLEWEEMTSTSLGGQTRTFGIYLPPSYHTSDKVYPSFYVLHGKYQNATSRKGIRSTLDRMIQSGEIGEMIAVLVNGDELSFYRDEYETHIVNELIEHVDTHYRTIPDGASRGITGYSMGAFGSMHLAFRHPEVFSVAVAQAIAAFSPAGNPIPTFAVFWPASGEWYHQDIGTYLTQPQRLNGIKVVHGISDPQPLASIEAARDYHQLLLDNGIDHSYVEHSGGHIFIDGESLPFLSERFSEGMAGIRILSASLTRDLGVSGQPLQVGVDVAVVGPSDVTEDYPAMALDLSPLGLEERVLLEEDGTGGYSGSRRIDSRIESGRRSMPLRVQQPDGSWGIVRLLTLEVWPATDVPIYVDACAPGWEANGRDLESLTVVQAGVVHTGNAACAVQGKKSFTGWAVEFQPDSPPHAFGYTTLRFAFHPGDAVLSEGERFALNAAPGRAVNLLVANWLDMDRKEWQMVEIPVELFKVEGPLESINLSGNFAGTFYVDDLRLIAGHPPPQPTTAAMDDETGTLPSAAVLEQNYPNPLNSSTVIRFALPETREVELVVFNLTGQQVARLVDGVREAGTHTVRWDGRDDENRKLASGIYLYQLRTGDRQQVETRKLLLIK